MARRSLAAQVGEDLGAPGQLGLHFAVVDDDERRPELADDHARVHVRAHDQSLGHQRSADPVPDRVGSPFGVEAAETAAGNSRSA